MNAGIMGNAGNASIRTPSLPERARRMGALLIEARPALENALVRGLTREETLGPAPRGTSPEAWGLAASLCKRGLKDAPALPFPSSQGEGKDAGAPLCAPCAIREGSALRAELAQRAQAHGIVVFVDARFGSLNPAWSDAVRGALPYSIEAREGNKTLDLVLACLRHLAQVPATCEALVSLGGGLTSDVCGFVAGLLGVPFEVIPTTYLAAVDAAQGGKTGVNAPPFGKNQIGLFHGARAFHLVPEVFGTLPPEERASGFGEALKHLFLYGAWPARGAPGTDASGTGAPAVGMDFSTLTFSPDALLWQMDAKVKVVEADPRERNVRRLLNLGHTLGHAWEGLQEEGLVSHLPHGIAVVFGLLALEKGGLLAGVPADFRSALEAILARFSPRALGPRETLRASFARLVRADKKNASADAVVFVTPAFGLLGSLPPADFASLAEARYVTRLAASDAFDLFEACLRS